MQPTSQTQPTCWYFEVVCLSQHQKVHVVILSADYTKGILRTAEDTIILQYKLICITTTTTTTTTRGYP